MRLRIVLINILLSGFLFLLLNLFSPYLFERLFSAPAAISYVPEGLRILLQSSKRSLIPQHYIALAGDSYAGGSGDWINSEMQTPHARYSAAHVLHDNTARDVISFGQPGAGSIRGMVSGPVTILN